MSEPYLSVLDEVAGPTLGRDRLSTQAGGPAALENGDQSNDALARARPDVNHKHSK